MKTKLLTLSIAACMAFSVKVSAQATPAPMTQIFADGFESWSGSPAKPAGWEVAPATTIAPDSVLKVVASGTVLPVYGTAACKLKNASSTYSVAVIAINSPIAVTAGTAYQISYSARGKGTVRGGVTDGSGTYANYAHANGLGIKGATWHRVLQSVIAPVTTSSAQFFLELKSTGTYTNTSGVTINSLDVDSFVVESYTPKSNVSLYDIEYTTATSGNSPFYGQLIKNTGGIVTALSLSSTGTATGYYIQSSGSNAWAGALAFDFTSALLVAVGDSVTFDCEVDEFFGMTELNQITNFVKVSSGHTIPTPVLLATAAISEQYEGLLVKVSNAHFGAITTYTASFGQWIVDDGSGPVLVDTKYDYPFTPTANTNYCLIGTVLENFGLNIDPHQTSDITVGACAVGIDTYKNNLHANVYPNPMTNALKIQLPFEAQKVSVSLVDVLGNTVMSSNTSGSQVNLTNNNLSAGVYMVKIIADGKTQMVKIIKE